jgi:hypothetical protein
MVAVAERVRGRPWRTRSRKLRARESARGRKAEQREREATRGGLTPSDGRDSAARASGRTSRATRTDDAVADLALVTTCSAGTMAMCSSLKHRVASTRQNQAKSNVQNIFIPPHSPLLINGL